MAAYLPPGWPAGVHPPGSEDFERTAVAWLLDVVPPDYRLYGVLRRHPIALAVMAGHHVAACVEGARQGYRTARSELGEVLPPHAIDSVLVAYRSEGRRLVATAQAVDLVTRALRGEVFRPQIRAGDTQDQKPQHQKPPRPEGPRPENPPNQKAPRPESPQTRKPQDQKPQRPERLKNRKPERAEGRGAAWTDAPKGRGAAWTDAPKGRGAAWTEERGARNERRATREGSALSAPEAHRKQSTSDERRGKAAR